MCVSWDCRVLSGNGLCVGLITRPDEFYRCGMSERDRAALIMGIPWTPRDCCSTGKKSSKRGVGIT